MTFLGTADVVAAHPSDVRDGEVPFDFGEIFFSRTDDRGVIQAGNAVFRRVSGYEGSRLIGAPHRIVRHPLMPKAAFHLLWERLKADRATGVYVCNRALDGRAYWVFAVVVPVGEGFLSVRIKPGTAMFDRVRAVYAELLAAEAQGATPAEGAADLMLRLKAAGFPGYDSFQAQALAAELAHRAERAGFPAPALAPAVNSARAADRIAASIAPVRDMLRKALHIAINLRIVAGHLGSNGRALGAIADNYASLSRDLSGWIEHQSAAGAFAGIAGAAGENLFLKAATGLLDEMAETFARDAEAGLGDPAAERERLSAAAAIYRGRAQECNERAARMALDLEAQLAQMRHRINALDAIRMQCRVEGAATAGAGGELDHIVAQLDRFQDEMGGRLTEIMSHGRDIQEAAAATDVRLVPPPVAHALRI